MTIVSLPCFVDRLLCLCIKYEFANWPKHKRHAVVLFSRHCKFQSSIIHRLSNNHKVLMFANNFCSFSYFLNFLNYWNMIKSSGHYLKLMIMKVSKAVNEYSDVTCSIDLTNWSMTWFSLQLEHFTLMSLAWIGSPCFPSLLLL